jgi:hypothetical protein
LETTETTYENNHIFLAAQLRGVPKSAGGCPP